MPLFRATPLLVLAIACVVFLQLGSSATLQTVRCQIAPSGDCHYALGDASFEDNSAQYDIQRASDYYVRALALNPHQPFAYHQLGRIEFLKGNFDLALYFLEKEFEMSSKISPSTYYVRALVKGYKGDIAGSAEDYDTYLGFDATNWAAINDYAWVLLQGARHGDARKVLEKGLMVHPNNPWLLNMYATVLFEMGDMDAAEAAARAAAHHMSGVDEQTWLLAYPGNDPRVATRGTEALHDAIQKNQDLIREAREQRALPL